jgi:prolyl 4-hydroxylase
MAKNTTPTSQSGETPTSKKVTGTKEKDQGECTKETNAAGSPKPKSAMSAWIHHLWVAVFSLTAGILTPPILILTQPHTTAPVAERALQSLPAHFTCDDETLSQYLHDVAIPGLHVVCFQEKSLTFYKNAQYPDEKSKLAPSVDFSDSIQDWGSLRSVLVEHLDLQPTDDLHQPWTTYTPQGERVSTEIDAETNSIESLRQAGMFLVFQGGQWIWPGVRKGFMRQVRLDDEGRNNVTLETLSLHPLVLSVKGFLTMDECHEIQTQAGPTMQYSGVSLMDADAGRPSSDFRTSQSTFLDSRYHPFLKSIEGKTASLVRLPTNHQEAVQVLRYGNSEKYDAHHDYFEPSMYQNDAHTQELIGKGLRNRMITVFWYLSDVAAGGETVFPRMDKVRTPPRDLECQMGLRVRPEAGKVIIFYSQTPDGKLDPYSLHGACPVKEGIKWAANKWVWNAPMGFVSDN